MNYNTNTDTELSLCIPRVFANIDEKRVRSVIEQLLGKISRVDIIERTNEKGEKYKRVFVHFDYWFETADAQTAKSRLIEGNEIKIVYDDPWFWKVSANKVSVNTRPKQRINLQQPTAKPPPRLEFDESREPQYPANNRPYNNNNNRPHDPRDYREVPRDYNRHQVPRDYRHQVPRDYRHQEPRDYRHQEPRDYRHQEPRDYIHQEPRDYIHQEPRDYRQPIALALQEPSVTMESQPVTVPVTVKEPKVKEPNVKKETKYKKESKPKSKIIIKPEPESESAAPPAEQVTTESQEQNS
jgi:hypothetical protein